MRQRLRDLGHRVGRFPPGPRNALTDVPGVRVGHATLLEGERTRTGVTAVLPHGGNPYSEKVLAGIHIVNGYGKPTGLVQIAELGTLESPILLTSTLSVGPVWEGGLRWLLELNPDAAIDRDTLNVVVGECFDGWLNDCRALPVRAEHALRALVSADEDEVSEGSVGAGTGTACFGFKSGIGHASRRIEGEVTLGCLVVANFGGRRDRHLLTGVLELEPDGPGPSTQGGSAVVVLATDAPLSERQLRRLAVRGGLGLGRAGTFAANGSGEFALAFSTACRLAHRSDQMHDELRFFRDDSPVVRQLFEAAVEVTAEAVFNSLCMAEAMEGRDGHRVEALPYEQIASSPALRPV